MTLPIAAMAAGSTGDTPGPAGTGTATQILYLARHGETVWNRERRFQGRLDSPLTARGREQARRMGETLARLGADGAWPIVASPLGRARETAAIIAGCLGGVPDRVVTDRRLAEIDVGCWSGLTFAAIEAGWPGTITPARRRDWFFAAPDGESYQAAQARLAAFLGDTAECRRLIVVTHGIASRLLRGLYLGLSREATLTLVLSQNAVFKLAGGAIEIQSCRPSG